MICPCKDCSNHSAYCHCGCNEYDAWKEEHLRTKKIKEDDERYFKYVACQIQRAHGIDWARNMKRRVK